MMPFPFSHHRGDRQLAAQLLYEHGLDPTDADIANPEDIECLAGSGRLTESNVDKVVLNDRIGAKGKFAFPVIPPIPDLLPAPGPSSHPPDPELPSIPRLWFPSDESKYQENVTPDKKKFDESESTK